MLYIWCFTKWVFYNWSHTVVMSADPSREEEQETGTCIFCYPPPPHHPCKEVKEVKVKTVYNSWLPLNTLVQDQDNLIHTVC